MNPLEHHTFIELFSSREQVCTSSEGTFILRSYHYSYMHYLRHEVRTAWWHHITCSSLTDFIKTEARQRGLLSINGIPTCLICLTNEFVRTDPKFNGGDPTCKCGLRYKGWGDESI